MADLKISQLTGSTTPLVGTEVLPVVQSGVTKQVSVANLTAGRDVATAALTSTKTSAGAVVDVATIQNANSTAGTEAALFFAPTAAAGNIRGARISAVNDGNNVISIKVYTGTGAAITAKYEFTDDGNIKQLVANKGVNFTANTPASGMTSQLLNWYEEGTWTPTIIGSSTAGTGTYSLQEGNYTRIGRQVTVTAAVTWSAHTGTGVLRVSGLPFTIRNDSVYAAFAMEYGNLTVSANAIAVICTRPGTTYLQVDETVAGGASQSGVTLDTAASLYFSVTYFV